MNKFINKILREELELDDTEGQFKNLIDLIDSTDIDNISLGLIMAVNFQNEIKAHYGCTIEEMQELFDLLNDNGILDEGLETSLMDITRITIRNVNLGGFPKSVCILKKLRYLDLSNTNITSIPKEIGQLVNLEDLYLMMNRISEIPKEIGKLVNLKYLELGDNELTELPEEIIQLVNLEILSLTGNRLLDTLPLSLATKNPKGLEIWLDNTGIETLPKEFLNVTLRYSEGSITILKEETKNSTKLKISKIIKEELELDDTEGQFKNLIDLIDSTNPDNISLGLAVATNYPNEIKAHYGSNIEEMQELFDLLNDNGILDEGLKTKMMDIRTIHITNVNLGEFPKSLCILKKLESLELSNCNITSIPKEIGRLKMLYYLDLRRNQISEIPKEIGKLGHLEILSLIGNRLLDTLPLSLATKNTKGLEIWLDNTGIETLPKEFLDVTLIYSKGDIKFLKEETKNSMNLKITKIIKEELKRLI